MSTTLIQVIKRLFLIWLFYSLILISLVLLFTILGKYGNHSGPIWLWLSVLLLPITILLFAGYVRHRNIRSLQLPKMEMVIFRVLIATILIYLTAILIALLLQNLGRADQLPIDKLNESNPAFYSFQFFLLLLLGIFIYRTELFIKANAAIATNDLLAENDKVFISYNHADKAIADEIRQLLCGENIEVIIDSENMYAGENIQKFIRRAIKESRITLSVVSSKSLLSGWVAIESVETFFLENYSASKKFIACYLDPQFFELSFTSDSIELVNKKLTDINLLIDKQTEMGVDTRDLNDEKTRLIGLKNNLDQIIQRLRSCLCIDIGDGKLHTSFPEILKAITVANEN